MGIYLSDAELDVLAECSGLACKVYLRLRRRMDLRTRLAGVMSSLSWQALVDAMQGMAMPVAGQTDLSANQVVKLSGVMASTWEWPIPG